MNKINIKLLPLENQNFLIKNTTDELIELLPLTTVILDELYNFETNQYNHKHEHIIGIVGDDNFIVKDNCVYGDVLLYDDEKSYEWVNAEIMIDEEYNIDYISAIQVKEI